jgi:hypothetical protein
MALVGQQQLVRTIMTLSHNDHSKNPFDLKEKQAWDGQRFGKLEHTHLGDAATVSESKIQWPQDHTMTVISGKNHHHLTYNMVNANSRHGFDGGCCPCGGGGGGALIRALHHHHNIYMDESCTCLDIAYKSINITHFIFWFQAVSALVSFSLWRCHLL